MRQEKPVRGNGGDTSTTTTGINTSIQQEEAMSAVQSSITAASTSWMEQMTQANREHNEAMQVVQLRHTQEMLEQTRESNKRYQVVQDYLGKIPLEW